MMKSSDAILITLRQIIRAIDLHSKILTRRHGLTGPQLIVLKAIHEWKDLNVSQLANKISLSPATVTTILDRLEKLQFVQRVRNASDKRKVNIILTERAEKVMEEAPNLLQEDFINRFEKLKDWEKLQLMSSLKRISEMMNAEDIASPPVLFSGPLDATEKEVIDFLDIGEI